MAGDWIKMESCTPDKAEVLALTARLGWDDPDLTVGKLFRIWRWFDQQTIDGNAVGVTSALLDRVVGVTGFCEAMADVGWLCIREHGVSLPNFDKHNGNTAKSRALTARRVANHKAVAPSSVSGNASANAESVTRALPREEKRREEISTSLRSVEGSAKSPPPRPARKCPETFEVTDVMSEWAKAEGADVDRETAKFRDHTFKTSISDWPGAWRNWIRKSVEFKPKASQTETFRERDSRRAAERVAAFTGGLAHDKRALAPLPFEPGHTETIEGDAYEARRIAG